MRDDHVRATNFVTSVYIYLARQDDDQAMTRLTNPHHGLTGRERARGSEAAQTIDLGHRQDWEKLLLSCVGGTK